MDSSEIDLKEAARLVADLERDLQKLSAGSADLQTVRNEVEALRGVLDSASRKDHGLRAALHAVRQALERVEGEAIRDWPYIAEIGRMLGMR